MHAEYSMSDPLSDACRRHVPHVFPDKAADVDEILPYGPHLPHWSTNLDAIRRIGLGLQHKAATADEIPPPIRASVGLFGQVLRSYASVSGLGCLAG